MMKLAETPAETDTMLLAGIADRLTCLLAAMSGNTKNVQLITDTLFGSDKKDTNKEKVFESPEAFEEAKARILAQGKGGRKEEYHGNGTS